MNSDIAYIKNKYATIGDCTAEKIKMEPTVLRVDDLNTDTWSDEARSKAITVNENEIEALHDTLEQIVSAAVNVQKQFTRVS